MKCGFSVAGTKGNNCVQKKNHNWQNEILAMDLFKRCEGQVLKIYYRENVFFTHRG